MNLLSVNKVRPAALGAWAILLCALLALTGCSQDPPEDRLRQADIFLRGNRPLDALALVEGVLETAEPDTQVVLQASMLEIQCLIQLEEYASAREKSQAMIDEIGLEGQIGYGLFINYLQTYLMEARGFASTISPDEALDTVLSEIDKALEREDVPGELQFQLRLDRGRFMLSEKKTTGGLEVFQNILTDESTSASLRRGMNQYVLQAMGESQLVEPQVTYLETYLDTFDDLETRELFGIYAHLTTINLQTQNRAELDRWAEKTLTQIDKLIEGSKSANEIIQWNLIKANFYRQVIRTPKVAIPIVEELLEKFPNSQKYGQVLIFYGETLRESGEFERARKVYERLVAEYPNTRDSMIAGQWLSVEDRWSEFLVRPFDAETTGALTADGATTPTERNDAASTPPAH